MEEVGQRGRPVTGMAGGSRKLLILVLMQRSRVWGEEGTEEGAKGPLAGVSSEWQGVILDHKEEEGHSKSGRRKEEKKEREERKNERK